jgi:hypothetical protein
MTNELRDPEYYDQTMLQADLEARREEEKRVAAESAEERLREDARAAFMESSGGTEPTEKELDDLVREKRAQETLERVKVNRLVASRQIRQLF